MFETDDDVSKFSGANNSLSHQPYMQRSASAPAIAEHVAEAQIPKYSYDESQLEVDPLYYQNGPSRVNPRIPMTKHQGEGEDDGVHIGDLLEDPVIDGPEGSQSILASLISDKSLRTPMDLIQEDFPSTPSSVFSSQSNRLFAAANATNAEGRFEPELDTLEESFKEDPLLSTLSTNNGGARNGKNVQNSQRAQGAAGGNGQVDATLDQAMQQLYVTGDEDLSSNSPRGASLVNHMSSTSPQQHHPSGNSGLQSLGIRAAGSGAAGGVGGRGNNPYADLTSHLSQPFNQQGQQPQHAGELHPGAPQYRLQQNQPPLGHQQMLQQQVYMPVDSNLAGAGNQHPGQGLAGQGNTPPGPGQQPGPMQHTTYYVQQPMYVDQHGQPVYYRVGPGGQFQQEMMYGGPGPDGAPGAEQGLPPYMQYPGGQGQQLNPQPGYWPPGQMDPQGGANGAGPVYVTGPGGQQMDGSGPNNMMRRVVYNQVGAPYNMSIVPGNGGVGGPIGSRPGAPYSLGAPGGMMAMRPPEMDMYRPMDRNKDFRRGGGGGGGGGGGMYDNRDEKRDNYRNDRGGRNNGRNNDYGRGGNNSSSVNPMRDPLVDDFRSTYGKTRTWELVDLLGHVVAFCQDQHGSRFIQQRLEVCTEVDKQLIFDEIISSAHSLMTDVFGNYVLQKLFEYGTPEQCETLALLLTGQSVQLSMQMYGCRVVQKALEYVSTQRLIALVSEFENPQVLLRCVHDSNGNHVIQKCIEVVSRVAKEATTPELSEYLSSRIQFIINAFQGRVKELSSHPYGCRVVQRILEHCSNPQKSVILEELRQCCSDLVQDCYGNYVIQFVMQHGWEADRAVLIKEVQAHLLEFSQHKFASNVVEKCLQYASKRDRDEMIWTIINVTFDLNNPVDAKTGHCVLESMVRDPYANYVVQKVIDVSDERQRAAIMRYVRENIVQLRRYTYGKHIIVRLEKITNEKF